MERLMSQLLAEESSTAWALEQLSAKQEQLKKQLQQCADELKFNIERQHYNLPVPDKNSSEGYAIESFTLSCGGPSESVAQAIAPSQMDSCQAAASSCGPAVQPKHDECPFGLTSLLSISLPASAAFWQIVP